MPFERYNIIDGSGSQHAIGAMVFDRDEGRIYMEGIDLSPNFTALATLINAIPSVDPADGETLWNDNGVLKVASAGG